MADYLDEVAGNVGKQEAPRAAASLVLKTAAFVTTSRNLLIPINF
jgi:hypothetical protein